MISQTAEYALRAIVDLAFHQGEARTAAQIAEATQVPLGYLSKILKDLSRQGLIRSQRGPGGGFALEHDPDRISVYDVIAIVDPPQRITRCPLGLEAHRVRLCPLHHRLDEAMAMVEKVFRETPISDVTADPSRRRSQSANLTISGGLAAVAPRRLPKSGPASR